MAVGVGLAATMATCWLLWVSNREFPLVPLAPVPVLGDVPAWSLVVCALAAPWLRIGRWIWVTFLLLAVWLVLGDVNRCQPWFYQACLMALAFALVPQGPQGTRSGLDACRLVLVFTYLWSGLHKFNYGFAHDAYPYLFQPVLERLPEGVASVVRNAWPVAAGVEALLGLGLFFPRTRPVAVIGLVGMHAFLLGLLGPFGINANSSVWPWNIGNAALVLILFWGFHDSLGVFERTHGWLARCAVVLLLGILPSLNWFSLWPVYLSGALYTGNQAQGLLLLTDEEAIRAPQSLADVLKSDGQRSYVNLSIWSLAAVNAPVFPEPWVLRRVAQSLCRPESEPGAVTLAEFERPGLFGPLFKRKDVPCCGEVRP
ncbi:MAG: hypothetical protein KF884_12250 [Fimbriimonadaceae bacterium]|nr:hypothetical protein [Fimbriimonadaceae bacterium]QYK58315.1 MAG: hypothetical protein KF884_12250 [Fimbriimonadaceae bacterium]